MARLPRFCSIRMLAAVRWVGAVFRMRTETVLCTRIHLARPRLRLSTGRRLQEAVFAFDAVQLFQHRFGGEPEKQPRRRAVDAVHGEAGEIAGRQDTPVEFSCPDERRGGIHDAAVDQDGRQHAENAQRASGAAQKPFSEQDASQKVDDTHGEHLPGGPRPLSVQHVGGQHSHSSHQKARLRSQGDPGQDGEGHDGLELRQHKKGGPARHADGAEYRDDHQLPCLGSAALKQQEKWQHGFYQDQQGDKIILPAAQKLNAHKQCQGDEKQDESSGEAGAPAEGTLLSGGLPPAIRRAGPPGDAGGEHRQRGDKDRVEAQLPGGQRGALRGEERRQVRHAQKMGEQRQDHHAGGSGQQLPPQGELGGAPNRRSLRKVRAAAECRPASPGRRGACHRRLRRRPPR